MEDYGNATKMIHVPIWHGFGGKKNLGRRELILFLLAPGMRPPPTKHYSLAYTEIFSTEPLQTAEVS